MSDWLDGAHVHDLHPAIGNGPFTRFLGVILHVNVDEAGTPDSFWGSGNAGSVCPNFQVYKDGSIHQMLPLNWQPWCQVDGNFNYAAVETAGMPGEPLTDAQVAAVGRICRAYHDLFSMPLKVANAPGDAGLGTHAMGGAAWGGHSCPGDIRTAQRAAILAAAQPPAPVTDPLEDLMAFYDDKEAFEAALHAIVRKELAVMTRLDSDAPDPKNPVHRIQTIVRAVRDEPVPA